MTPRILWEDNHCLVISKPAGLLAQGDASGEPTVIDWAKDSIKTRYQKIGNVYIGLVHRLDRPVSGVLVLARTSKAARRLSQQFHDGLVEKVYWAIAEGEVAPAQRQWRDFVAKEGDRNLVRVVEADDPEGKECVLDYRVVGVVGGRSSVEVRLHSGRSHQIRVQFAVRGFPLLGDHKYGSKRMIKALDGGFRIALHARSITFKHPTRSEAISVVAPLPEDWPGGWFEAENPTATRTPEEHPEL